MSVFVLDWGDYFTWRLEIGGTPSLCLDMAPFLPFSQPSDLFLPGHPDCPQLNGFHPFQFCWDPYQSQASQLGLLPTLISPTFVSILAAWAENNRPGDFQSVTRQVTLSTHMLIHVFTRNESLFMRQSVLSTWPPFLYFIQKDISTER